MNLLEPALEWRVWAPSGNQHMAGRLCGIHKSEEAIEQAERRLARKQQRGKEYNMPENRKYACYVLGVHHVAEESSF